MKHPATRELFAYWDMLRGSRAAPERGDIDPSAIRAVLADSFMLEVDMAQRFPFRLAGTRVNGLFEADLKGRSLLSLWRAEERHNIAAVLLTVADSATPVIAGAAAGPRGQVDGAFELMFLPLRHYGRTHSRILGLIKPVTPPAWLGLLPMGPLSLRSLRILDDTLDTNSPAVVATQRFSRGPDAFVSGTFALDGGVVRAPRPHLRLIHGGR